MKRILSGIFSVAMASSLLCAATSADLPIISQQPLNLTITNGGTAVFNVAVSGTGPFTYQWQLNGTNLYATVTTVVGNGDKGYSGDAGLATKAALNCPGDVAFDGSGNLFIADFGNRRVRKVDAGGIITTVAGHGSSGYIDDGVPADQAFLSGASDIALDKIGNLLIKDDGSIRKVDTNGIITTVVRPWLYWPSSIALDTSGNLYFADSQKSCVYMTDMNGNIRAVAGIGTSGFSGDGGPATRAELSSPGSITVDHMGNLLIADSGNYRIRKVDANGIITTVAGKGGSGLIGDGGPATNAILGYVGGIAPDRAGNLFIAESGRIRKVDTSGIITTIAGSFDWGYSGDGGPAISAKFDGLYGMSFDDAGDLFVADSGNNRIRKVSLLSATSPALTLAHLSRANAGNYSVIISNSSGAITSSVVALTVLTPPDINSQTTNQNVFVGRTASFSVNASGTAPLSYFWFCDGQPIPGANDSSYSYPNPQLSDSGTQFSCLVSNAYGSITSEPMTLAVALPPTITQQPVPQARVKGQTAAFNVAVSGDGPFTYQWQLNGTNLCPLVTTIAGNGVAGFSGDGGPATSAALYRPSCLVVDGAGNLFFIDDYNNRIRKVDTNGIITTIAGNGKSSYSGDGGPATNAGLVFPYAIAFDNAGNFFVNGSCPASIRKVDTNGIITKIAGDGTGVDFGNGSGMTVDAAGDLIVVDFERIFKIDSLGITTTIAGCGTNGFSGDGGPATNAMVWAYGDIAFDRSGNLFFTDWGNKRIRKIDANGIITTVAGNGDDLCYGDDGPAISAGLNSPTRIAVDSSGNLFIAHIEGNHVRKVDTQGIITTVAGNGIYGYSGDGGPATNAGFYHPSGMAIDAAGNLLIADSYNNRIRHVSLSVTAPKLTLANITSTNAGDYSVIITSPFGSITSSVAHLTVLIPPDICAQPTNQTAFVGESATFSVNALGTAPLNYSWLRNGEVIAGASSSTCIITNLQLSDSGAQFACLVSNSFGSITSQLATLTVALPLVITQQPVSQTLANGKTATFNVNVSGSGPFAYQWRFNGTNLSPVVSTVAGNGDYGSSGDGGSATNATFSDPENIAFDTAGNLFISDITANCIRRVDTNGIITTIAGNKWLGYSGDGGPATSAMLSYPNGVAFDSAGNLFIADSGNDRVRKVDVNGTITTVAGARFEGDSGDGGPATNAVLSEPVSIALDKQGNLYIAELGNRRVRKVDTNGIITTVAGNGTSGYSGDGGPATSACLSAYGIALDGSDNLFISDYSANRVRKVDANGIITTVAGGGSRFPGNGGPANLAQIYPNGLAFDAAGNLFIADWHNSCVRKVDPNGIITTVAGGGSGLAFDAAGNLFIADDSNRRIRKVTYLSATTPTLTLPNAGPANAGDYSVIITSPYCSITSSVVALSLSSALPPQDFTGFITQETNLALRFKAGTPNYPYTLQTTTNLTPPIRWESLLTNWTDTSGLWNLTVSNPPALPARFYRILVQ